MSQTERQNIKTVAVNQPLFQADSFPFVAVLHPAHFFFTLVMQNISLVQSKLITVWCFVLPIINNTPTLICNLSLICISVVQQCQPAVLFI